MINYKLIRQPAEGKCVRAKLYKVLPGGEQLFLCNTLENAEYIIPTGTYPLVVTESPKFKHLMPLVCQVPGRSGIRIHRGSRPEHSKSCILIAPAMEQELTARWLAEQSSHEEIRLEIVDDYNKENKNRNNTAALTKTSKTDM